MAPTRKGKIARLPARLREQLNQRLHDGEPASKILPWLNGQEEVLRVLDEHFGEEPITPQNLSEWRQGGFQEWLNRRDQVERTKELATYAARLAQGGGDSLAGGVAMVGGQLLEVLESLDVEEQKRLLSEQPETYIELVGQIARLRKSEADHRKATAAERAADLAERKLDLDQAKFQRQTCELFIKWYEDERARRIADSKDTREVKVDQLRLLLFGPEETGKEQHAES